jgi:hypothetical protein
MGHPARGLVLAPEEWNWSSYRHYALGERGPVPVNEAQSAEMGCAKSHSVRRLAPSSMGLWHPLAENRGEWGSLSRGGARS